MSRDPEPQLEFPIVRSATTNRQELDGAYKGFLLNPARVRRYALDLAERERHHAFSEVSVEFIQRIDARLRNIIRDEIKRHPSRGKRLA